MDSIIQAQGIHHITLNGADKKTSIDFWQNILGMKFIFEQPNLDDLNTNHLYFDCGDGTTVTVFTNENLIPNKNKLKNECGGVHHVAFWVSQSTIRIAENECYNTLFPSEIEETVSFKVISQMHDGLVALNPKEIMNKSS